MLREHVSITNTAIAIKVYKLLCSLILDGRHCYEAVNLFSVIIAGVFLTKSKLVLIKLHAMPLWQDLTAKR